MPEGADVSEWVDMPEGVNMSEGASPPIHGQNKEK